MAKQKLLPLTEEQATFLHNAICLIPDDARDDGDEEILEYLLAELDSILSSFTWHKENFPFSL